MNTIYEQEKQNKKSKRKYAITYTLILLALEAVIIGATIGILAIASHGELITTGSLSGDIALTATSIAALFNILLFMLITAILYIKNRAPVAIIEKNNTKEVIIKETVNRDSDGIPNVPMPDRRTQTTTSAIVPAIPVSAPIKNTRDKKWMSHVKPNSH